MSVTQLRGAKASALKKYVEDAGDLPPDIMLGRIVLFTITDEPVAHKDLEKWFDELGLDKSMMPSAIRELDAFKKATSELNKGTYPLSKERTAHLLCRDVASTTDYVKRQITREVKDSRRKRLSYTSAIDATFYRASDANARPAIKLITQAGNVEFEEMPHLEALVSQIQDGYARYRDFHDGQKLRGVVRNYLKHLNAIEIKGGVYFIHVSRDNELGALSELVNRFGGGCSMNTIPIVNLERERAFIVSAFEREAAQQLQDVTKECQSLIGTRKKVTVEAVSKAKARYDDVMSKAQEHMMTLQMSQDVTAASAEVALAALTSLQEAME